MNRDGINGPIYYEFDTFTMSWGKFGYVLTSGDDLRHFGVDCDE